MYLPKSLNSVSMDIMNPSLVPAQNQYMLASFSVKFDFRFVGALFMDRNSFNFLSKQMNRHKNLANIFSGTDRHIIVVVLLTIHDNDCFVARSLLFVFDHQHGISFRNIERISLINMDLCLQQIRCASENTCISNVKIA